MATGATGTTGMVVATAMITAGMIAGTTAVRIAVKIAVTGTSQYGV